MPQYSTLRDYYRQMEQTHPGTVLKPNRPPFFISNLRLYQTTIEPIGTNKQPEVPFDANIYAEIQNSRLPKSPSKFLAFLRFLLILAILFSTMIVSLCLFVGLAAFSDSMDGGRTNLAGRTHIVAEIKKECSYSLMERVFMGKGVNCRDFCELRQDPDLFAECLRDVSPVEMTMQRIRMAIHLDDDRMRRVAARFLASNPTAVQDLRAEASIWQTVVVANIAMFDFCILAAVLWFSALKIVSKICGCVFERFCQNPRKRTVPTGSHGQKFTLPSVFCVYTLIVIFGILYFTPTTYVRLNRLMALNEEFARRYYRPGFAQAYGPFQIRANSQMLFDTLYEIPFMRLIEQCVGVECSDPFVLN